MQLSVTDRRNEAQTVFVTHKLRDLRENSDKIRAGDGKEGPATTGLRDGREFCIGLGKHFIDRLRLRWDSLLFLGTFFLRRLGEAQFSAERNGQYAHVGRFQSRQQILHGGRR